MICLLDHQQEDAAGDHGHAVVVAPVQSPKAPAAVGRFHIATFDKSLCGFERAKAQRGTVSRVDRDLFALGRHFGCLDRREGVY